MIAPEDASSENVVDFVQFSREIVTTSVGFVSGGGMCRGLGSLPCVRVATKKYWPDGCHTAEQSYSNSSDLGIPSAKEEPIEARVGTHSALATAGITPSMSLTSLPSPSETSQTIKRPSAPLVVYEIVR